MAKELPYFKFEPNQWENGNIQICTRDDKGLFMDLCSMYWSRLGDVPFKLAVQKLCNGNATAFDTLIKENIFTIIDDRICIDFLNEQLSEFENLSKTNSDNARIGWEKRKKNATASKSQCESNTIREEKRREEKEDDIKILNNSLLSEIKISDDKKFFLVKDLQFEITEEKLLHYKTALGFQKLFIKNLKEKKSPTSQTEKATYKNFVEPIRLIFEKKEATKEQLREAYEYLNSKEGEFWKSNILSTKKLREKLSMMILKKNTKVIDLHKKEISVPNPNQRKRIT
jgi:hypothetical protein